MLLDVLRELFPILAILYVLEGVAWVGARNLLFVRWPWGWRAAEGRGLRAAGFLPFDYAVSAAGPLVIATADALHVPHPESRGGQLYDPEQWVRLGYEQASAVVEEGTVRLGGRHVVRFPSRAHAEGFAGLLAEIRPLSPEARGKRLARQRAAAFDLHAAEQRLDALRARTELVRILGWGLFVLLLLLLPAVLYLHPRPERLLVPLLLGILLLYGAVLAAASRAGRSLRDDGVLRRAPSLLPLVFSPVAATRAVATLARDLFAGFDPLLLSALLLKKGSFLERARAELHGAAFSMKRASERGDEGWKRDWEERRKAVLRLLDRCEIGEAEALAPPARRDPDAAAWCPVCGTETRLAGGSCDDCGLPLVRFPDQTRA
jgi:hypothetical protein